MKNKTRNPTEVITWKGDPLQFKSSNCGNKLSLHWSPCNRYQYDRAKDESSRI